MEALFDVFNPVVVEVASEEPDVTTSHAAKKAKPSIDAKHTLDRAWDILDGKVGPSYDLSVSAMNDFMVEFYQPVLELSYEPYTYQKISAVAIDRAYGVSSAADLPVANLLVSSPTGSGKTLVIKHAAMRALQSNKMLVVGVPLVALAEQQFSNLRKVLQPFYTGGGESPVGIRTGPSEKYVDAPVMIMTFEVICIEMALRPAWLRDSPALILDEIHYMADKDRGARVEFIASNLPPDTCLVGLSGTIPNAVQFANAMTRATGRLTRLTGLKRRPIRIRMWAHLGGKLTEICHNRDGTIEQRFKKKAWDYVARKIRDRPKRLSPGQIRGRVLQLFADLEREDKFPAMIVGFSCRLLNRLAHGIPSVDLTDASQKSYIHRRFEDIRACVGPEWPMFVPLRDMCKRGIGVHHSQQPKFYLELLPDLVRRGMVKAVFATSTLSVGIDLPCRSVVMLSLIRPGKNGFGPVEPNLLKQVMGRAGRPGLETEGNFVLAMWQQPDERVNVKELLFAPSAPCQGNGMVAPREIVTTLLHHKTAEDLLLSPFSSADTSHVDPVLADLETLYADRDPAADGAVQQIERLNRARDLAEDSSDYIRAMLRKVRKGDTLVIDPEEGTLPDRWTVESTRPLRCKEYRGTVPHRWVLDCEPARLKKCSLEQSQRTRELRATLALLFNGNGGQVSDLVRKTYRIKRAKDLLLAKVGIESHPLFDTYQKYLRILEKTGFLDGKLLTSKGKMVPGIIGCDDVLTLVHAWTNNVIPRDSPASFASALSCFLQNKRHNQPPPDDADLYDRLCALQEEIGDDNVAELGTNMMRPIRDWVEQKILVHEICEAYDYASPGHLSKTIQRLVQLLEQMEEAAYRVNDEVLGALCDQTKRHVTRGLPFLESFYLK